MLSTLFASNCGERMNKDYPTEAPKQIDLADGSYQVSVALSGGSGRASVESPARLCVMNDKVIARIIWSSSTYDYMIVNGLKYEPIFTQDHSIFEIPVSGFDTDLPVVADTFAMSEPHEIEYMLRFDSATLTVLADGDPL